MDSFSEQEALGTIATRARSAVAFVLSGLLLLVGPCVDAAAQSSAPRPNMVLIMSDDVGYSDIGCHGGEINPHFPTPGPAQWLFQGPPAES